MKTGERLPPRSFVCSRCGKKHLRKRDTVANREDYSNRPRFNEKGWSFPRVCIRCSDELSSISKRKTIARNIHRVRNRKKQLSKFGRWVLEMRDLISFERAKGMRCVFVCGWCICNEELDVFTEDFMWFWNGERRIFLSYLERRRKTAVAIANERKKLNRKISNSACNYVQDSQSANYFRLLAMSESIAKYGRVKK